MVTGTKVTTEEATRKLDAWMKEYQTYDEEIKGLAKTQQGFLAQYQENEMVKQELDLLKEEEEGKEEVFKLVGPTLLKVPLDEAKASIKQRLDRFKAEIEKLTDASKEKMRKQEELKQKAIELRKKVHGAEKAESAQPPSS